ncbi:O-methyltransferase [Peribacillus simplex]|uniref:O-methyltransferase n=1 Tax=Peribacillus simplex TaxID=1478 RepID=A0AAN2PKV8_9BACI|nr:O-methyltransferase [Peribacillus simplex]
MKQINSYIDSLFYTKDDLLEEVIASILENGMPSISVSPSSGKLLTMLISISGAKNVLEIGALGGYSGDLPSQGIRQRRKINLP